MTDSAAHAADPAADPSAPPTAPRARRHRLLVGTLLTLAALVSVFAVMAVWVNRQALNTDNVTDTSSKILADKQVQTALSAYLVNELFKSVNVESELKSVLPPQLQGLAGPASAGLRELANRVAPQLLASQQAQQAFGSAVHAAHKTFLKILNGGGKTVSTKNGTVTLNLHQLVNDLAAQLGVQSQVAAVQAKLQGGTGQAVAKKLGVTPPPSGQLVLMRSSQLSFAQDLANAIKNLAIALPLIALALYAVAVWVAKDRRRRALRTVGWCLFGVGLTVLIVRRVGGNAIVNSLVKVQSNKPAVHDVWNIGTTLLYDIAVALVVFGLVVVVAAWLGGHTRPATALRRMLAPTLRDHPVRCYGAAVVALLLLVLLGPTPATRQVVPLIILAVVLAIGVTALRRGTAEEFPNARAGDTIRSLRDWYSARRDRAPAIADGGNGQRIGEIERLVALHDRGDLTDAEFASEKAHLIEQS